MTNLQHCFRCAFPVLSSQSCPVVETAAGTYYCAALIPHYP
ncbi:hypothetical protein PAMC26510_12810 [Caballeronia sordidicola]|uniref:Uncharacterized protein n=1 Tax=Caballeronia sordidicola TaxID=196367 RepID=A0A242MX51_CABSO|nr:hypothetical protein PAMC26510_12810 [Caballeronia sordidicola]